MAESGRAKRWVVVRPPSGGTGLLLAEADGEEQRRALGNQTGGRVAFFLRVNDFAAAHRANERRRRRVPNGASRGALRQRRHLSRHLRQSLGSSRSATGAVRRGPSRLAVGRPEISRHVRDRLESESGQYRSAVLGGQHHEVSVPSLGGELCSTRNLRPIDPFSSPLWLGAATPERGELRRGQVLNSRRRDGAPSAMTTNISISCGATCKRRRIDRRRSCWS